MWNKIKSFLFIGLVAVTAGCTTTEESVVNLTCPQTGLMREASVISYMDGDKIQVQALFDRLSGGCRFIHDLVEQDLSVSIYAERDAENTQEKQDISYFIAILDPNDVLLRKQEFTVSLEFGDDNRAQISDVITQLIPVSSAVNAGQYKVTVGFVLTEKQLNDNRQKQK